MKDARGPESKGLGGIYKDRRITVKKRRAPTKVAVAAEKRQTPAKATVAPVETAPPVTTKTAVAAVKRRAPAVTTKVEQHPREAFRGP